MPSKPTQYVVVPANGLVATADAPHEMQFFQTLHQAFNSSKGVHNLATHAGVVPVRVIDSIGENKAKLIECLPENLPAFRASNPTVRVLPVVYYRRAVVRYQVQAKVTTALATAKAAAAMTITVTAAGNNKPVAKVMVVAFTDFANRVGAQGTTNSKGQVSLNLGAASKKIERLYLYPASGFWPGLQQSITLKNGATVTVAPIDLSFTDCVRFFYPGNDVTFGKGVVVGVIDSGVATNHKDLAVQGGQNTVTGEDPKDFGDNGTEGHGTHVAGIIAAAGTPPNGIRGIAPGVTLRSYRVFGKGGDQAQNFSIAKAIDAAVADQCDLINMSLGGGDPDTLTAESLTAAQKAGVVVFAANGNDSRKPVSFPAANSMCQAVSAMGRIGTFPPNTEPGGSVAKPSGTDKNNFVADFSNVGAETDLTGPGVGVISTVPTGYGVMSGTSMATPAETGAAARLLATKPDILKMARGQERATAMIAAIAQASKLFGFGATFEGKGMITD